MGLFSTVKGAFVVGAKLEKAKTLAREIDQTMKKISTGAEDLRMAIAQEFLNQREKLLCLKPSLTPEQQIDMGRRCLST